MKRVLYTKYNLYRRPEYQLSTAVVAEDNEKFVVKKPLSELAVSHIETIKNNYLKLKNVYSGIIPVEYTENENSLIFPFLHGNPLIEIMEKGDIDIEQLISKISEIITKILEVKEEYRVDFKRTDSFDKVFSDAFPEEGIPAVSFCNVDSIISNFIKCGETIYCIDYEWCFDFPIPVDYLRYRILISLFNEKKSIFQDRITIDEFLGLFSIDESSKKVYEAMEVCFQKYVHGNSYNNAYTSRYQKRVLRFEDILTENQNQKQLIQDQNDHIQNLDINIDDLKNQVSEKNDQIALRDGLINDINNTVKEKNEQIQKQRELIENLQLETARYRKAFRNPFYNLYLKSVMVGISAKKAFKKKIEPIDYFEKYNDLTKVPYQNYEEWILNKESKFTYNDSFSYKPKISILVPVYNVLDKHLIPCIESVLNQIYDNWELCLADDNSTFENVRETLKKYEDNPKIKVVYREKNGHISEATNSALKVATGEFVGLLDCDDILSPNALYEVVKELNKNKALDFIYSDEDKVDEDGRNRHMPHFKPDWSPDTLMTNMYTCHFTVYRKSIIDELGGLRSEYNGSQDYDLALRVMDKTTPDRIAHIDKILYHWVERDESTSGNDTVKPYVFDAAKNAKLDSLKRRGLSGRAEIVEGIYQYNVIYDVVGSPLVSIIIPSKDNYEVLKRCIESINEKTSYKNYEIVLVDNGSNDENKKKYTELSQKYNIKYIYEIQDFNFSRMCNTGVKNASGEYILLLNDDIEILESKWLETMLGHAELDYVGAVGCKLLYPDNDYIQHVGVINIENGPTHEFAGKPDDIIYYFGRNVLCHNVIGVTAACLLIKKSKYEEVGGLDESFAVAYNDVDFCMKLIEKGYYNVVRNDIKNYHHESVSRGNDLESIDKLRRLMNEEDRLYSNHPKFSHYDPFYNTNLTWGASDFSNNYLDYKLELSEVKERTIRNRVSSEFHGNIDGCSVQRYILIEGWCIQPSLEDNNANDIKLILRNDKHTYVIDTFRVYRPDITELYTDIRNIEFTGFRCRFHRSEIEDGVYKIFVMIDNVLFDLNKEMTK